MGGKHLEKTVKKNSGKEQWEIKQRKKRGKNQGKTKRCDARLTKIQVD